MSQPTRMRVFASTLFLLLFASLSVRADVIYLRNGNRLEGEATRHPDGEVEIVSVGGSLRLPGAMVDRIEQGPTREALALAELETLASDDLGGRFRIAEQLEESGASTLARAVLHEILRIDPDHAGARRALGQRRCDGEWLTEEECHERRDEVLYKGRWIPTADWARMEALALEARRRDAERRLEQARLEALRAESQRLREEAWYSFYSYPFYPWLGWPVLPPGRGPRTHGPEHGERQRTPSPPARDAPEARVNRFRASAPSRTFGSSSLTASPRR